MTSTNRIARLTGWLAMATVAALASGCVMGSPGYLTGGEDGYRQPYDGYRDDYRGVRDRSAGHAFRCESVDERTRRCAADTHEGVRLVRQLSDSRCTQGQTWGYDAAGVWVSRGCRAEFVSGYGARGGYPSGAGPQMIRCESQDNRNQECRMDTRGGVQLVRQLSDTPCIRGTSWGTTHTGIWVSRGCRADFSVGRGDDHRGPGTGGHGGHGRDHDPRQTVVCESVDKRRRQCNARVVRDVVLLRQLSDTRCIEGHNWGWNRSGIWVDDGCRAEFGVR